MKVSIFIWCCLILITSGITACSKPEATPVAIKLDYSPDNQNDETKAAFSIQESWVVRCLNPNESDNSLTANATKAKNNRIQVLIFINLPDQPLESVQALCIPIDGNEAEYDIGKGRFKQISYQSAKNTVDIAGLTYDNWLQGTLSDAEQFPCCQ